jgi:hypothetical protein
MKITGKEFNDWYENGWPGDNWYHDDYDETIFDDATGKIKDESETYDTRDLGALIWQGPEFDAPAGEWPIDKFIRKWRKEKTTFSVYVTGPKDRIEEIEWFCYERGFKLRK